MVRSKGSEPKVQKSSKVSPALRRAFKLGGGATLLTILLIGGITSLGTGIKPRANIVKGGGS